jgi:glycosyltransferase involved in cell wall biosynthesis
MIKDRDIVVIGIQPWDIPIGSNCKNIAQEFALNNRVLYVNPPLDRNTRRKNKEKPEVLKRVEIIKGLKEDLYHLSKNLWNLYPKNLIESINWLPSYTPVFNWINMMSTRKFAKDIQSAINRLGFKDYILFNDSSMFLGQHITKCLSPNLYVYYMRDFLVLNQYWRKHGLHSEPLLMKSAHLIVTNSSLYAEYGKQFNNHSYMVGQGCDTKMFEDNESIVIPSDLAEISGVKIGYVGYLTGGRLDIPLIEYIAKARTEWNIVLVGPEDERFKASSLHTMKNVKFLGSRNVDQLPAYIKGFDVAINPQIISKITDGNYPRKIDEYLVMGKPVVCSATKTMEYFGDSAYSANSPEQYLEFIEKALHENSPEKQAFRIKLGKSHTWEANVAEIYKFMELVAKEKNIKL